MKREWSGPSWFEHSGGGGGCAMSKSKLKLKVIKIPSNPSILHLLIEQI